MNIYKKISLLFVLALILSGCKNLMPISEKHKEDNNINILNLEFEPEYKYFHANIKLNDSIAALLLLNDTTIKFHVEEYMQNNLLDSRTQPKLINIQKKITNLNLNILTLVDLTLDSMKVESQKQAIKELKELLPPDDLHISFIKNQTLSETIPATNYVLDNYFKTDPGKKYLYRSILSKIDEIKENKNILYQRD